jgi:hypothetical protein
LLLQQPDRIPALRELVSAWLERGTSALAAFPRAARSAGVKCGTTFAFDDAAGGSRVTALTSSQPLPSLPSVMCHSFRQDPISLCAAVSFSTRA